MVKSQDTAHGLDREHHRPHHDFYSLQGLAFSRLAKRVLNGVRSNSDVRPLTMGRSISARLVAAMGTAILLSSAASDALGSETLSGRASVIDGDTIEIHGARIRILDIDAPESRQTCGAQDGMEWRCGQKSALALADWIAQQTVTCESDQLDKYNRRLARCTVAGQDLGVWMAANGWAVAYRDCKCEVIRDAAARAKASRLGIWAGTFMLPWEWRAQPNSSQGPATQGSSGCQIKGNISTDGERIYHVPGGKWYSKTKIDEAKGERWFCSEADARVAGWRPAKQ